MVWRNLGIDKLTFILNEIYDSGEISEDLSKSMFTALTKKPGATECELHRTISLMSHTTKTYTHVDEQSKMLVSEMNHTDA